MEHNINTHTHTSKDTKKHTGTRTHTTDTVHKHTDIHATYTQTGRQVHLFLALSPLPPGRSVRPTLSHVVSAVISPSRVCRDSVARVFRIPTDGSGKSHIYQSRSYSVIRPRDLAVPRVWYCEEVLRTLSCALRGSPGSPQMAQAKAIYIKVGVTTGLGHKTPWPCSSTRRYYGPALSHCVR